MTSSDGSTTDQLCELVSRHSEVRRDQVRPETRFLEDLHYDSLEMVELLMSIEDHFGIRIPDSSDDPISKAVFQRRPFRIADLAYLVDHQLRVRDQPHPAHRPGGHTPALPRLVPFTQCGLPEAGNDAAPLLQPIRRNEAGYATSRRRTDGMRCVLIPAATCDLGFDNGYGDERPRHSVRLSEFFMDCEPVSVLAYCLFLNSIDEPDAQTLSDWLIPSADDHRRDHLPIVAVDGHWQPRTVNAGAWPMVMVSWYGANAYSRWANGIDWRDYKDRYFFAPGQTTLPSEAQWEYAARGATYHEYPWGAGAPTPKLAHFGLHQRKRSYTFEELPLAPVNAVLGVSPFGLLHMAGNVWNWCADAHDPAFYTKPESLADDPIALAETGNRSERGGSWIGSGTLLRSSFRRGRATCARGRCLGFRCTSAAPQN